VTSGDTRAGRGGARLAFHPDELLSALAQFPETRRYWVAYSGGCDSVVLLHALATLRPRLAGVTLHAVHVHHGLQPDADAWAQHCQSQAALLGIECTVLRVDARAAPGESREAAARTARYQALARLLRAADVLLTAHHQDDQAETVLLHLLRGSGADGLAAMAFQTPLGAGVLGRPLLGVSRDALRAYARHHDLFWVEDPSNFDTSLDRNYLRHELIPRMVSRWSGAVASLARTAAYQGENSQLLAALARQDLHHAQGIVPGTLRVPRLLQLDEPRQRNVLRYWLRQRSLPLPSSRHLAHVLRDVLRAPQDGQPCVRWRGTEIRRYRDDVYGLPALPSHDAGLRLSWLIGDVLQLPEGLGSLRAHAVFGRGIRQSACGATVTVAFRRGGERCRLPGASHRRELRTLFQERGVPPWQRDRTPFIYIDGQLAAVVGFCVSSDFAATGEELGWLMEWQRPTWL
jgi:tRNA(Ile)-lysidine synthase